MPVSITGGPGNRQLSAQESRRDRVGAQGENGHDDESFTRTRTGHDHACATNPVPVKVPGQRVVRTDGGLGGYLGGPAAKRTMLSLEVAG